MIDLPTAHATRQGQTVIGSGPDLLAILLDAYFDELEELGVPVRSHLAPGLSPSVTRELLEADGLAAPDEIVAWFEKFNGPAFGDGEAPFYLFPGSALHSLETAVKLRAVDRQAVGFGHEVWQWNAEWLRLGDPVVGLAVRCAEPTDAAPLVRHVGDGHGTNGDDAHQVVSLCTPVVWWIEALRAGRFLWDADARRWNFPPSPVEPGTLTRRMLGG